MEANIATIIAVSIVAVAGFVFLAWTMFAVWRNFGRRKDSLFSSSVPGEYIEDPASPDECYDECMRKSGWDQSRAHACAKACNW